MFVSGFHIAKNTFRESLREPIYLLILLASLVLIGIYPLFTLFVFREQLKLVVDSAMATTMVFGWITAVLCASHAIAKEINNGTALLLLSKPVQRPVFLMAKIAGILMALTVFCGLLCLATMIAVRVAKDQFRLDNKALLIYFAAIVISCAIGGIRNYVKRSSFPMATVLSLTVVLPIAWLIIYWVPVEGKQVGYTWSLVPALILVRYSVLTMGTLATALSTRLEFVSNMIVCSVIFGIGLMSDFLLGRHAEDSLASAVLYGAVPNWQLFWMADALAAGKRVPWSYVGLATIYISLFVAFFIVVAMFLFYNREVGKQSLT